MRVIRFTASWCQPCKQLANILSEVEKNTFIETIDIDEQSDVATEFGIRSVPTMVMLDGNIEVKRMIGLHTKKEIQEWLNG